MTVIAFQRKALRQSRNQNVGGQRSDDQCAGNGNQLVFPIDLPHLKNVYDLDRFRSMARLASYPAQVERQREPYSDQFELELGSLEFPDELSEMRIRPFLTEYYRNQMTPLEEASIETFYDYLTANAVEIISRVTDIALIREIENLIEEFDIKTVMSIVPPKSPRIRLVS